MHIFGQLVHIFGELAHIFGKLVHIFARKLVSRTSKQVSKNLGPLWQPGVYNDTKRCPKNFGKEVRQSVCYTVWRDGGELHRVVRRGGTRTGLPPSSILIFSLCFIAYLLYLFLSC